MVAASVLLILVAVVLLVAGLASGSSLLLIISIAASLLSAVVFVAFARQAAATRATAGRGTGPRTRTARAVPFTDEPVSPVPHHTSTVSSGAPGWRQPPGSPVTAPDDPSAVEDPPPAAYSPAPDEPFDVSPPAAEPYPPAERYSPAEPYPPPFDAEPYSPPGQRLAEPTSPAPGGPSDDGPPAEFLSAGEVARLVRVPGEVRVVDGHPRFHLFDCPHLVGRDDEALPVAEAVGLGFSPCADCAAATTLLADIPPHHP
ncbi:hypothetical protein [Micromonospora sp. DT31]|uniref:hypothetical protein n=1 Tax=Micromonospora sp. DT31 TaxID=3393434 RepID=UPI003CE7D693